MIVLKDKQISLKNQVIFLMQKPITFKKYFKIAHPRQLAGRNDSFGYFF